MAYCSRHLTVDPHRQGLLLAPNCSLSSTLPSALPSGTGTNEAPLVSPAMGLTHMAVGEKRGDQSSPTFENAAPNCGSSTFRHPSPFAVAHSLQSDLNDTLRTKVVVITQRPCLLQIGDG